MDKRNWGVTGEPYRAEKGREGGGKGAEWGREGAALGPRRMKNILDGVIFFGFGRLCGYMKTQAFVLAAGLGTRLRPLTDSRPKALVEVEGRPLLEILLHRLAALGTDRVVVNVHHFGDMVIKFLESREWGMEVLVSDERGRLLDTGGGLKKARPLFWNDCPILVHNVDILSRIDLRDLLSQHADNKCMATLAVSDRSTSRYLLWDTDSRLVGWHNRSTGEYKWADGPKDGYKPLAFSGVAVVEPSLLDKMPPADEPYSIIPAYLDAAKDHVIRCLEHDPADWLDVGKPDTIEKAGRFLVGPQSI